VLDLPSDAPPRALDDFVRTVHAATGQALRVPLKLYMGGLFGTTVQAVQTIATWARLSERAVPVVVPPSFATSPATQQRLGSTLQGMAALYFAPYVQAGNQRLERYDALQCVVPRVKAMDEGDLRNTLRGVSCGLVCFAGARSEYLRPLYSEPEPGGVRAQTGFRVLVKRLLSQVSPSLESKLDQGQLELLSDLTHQLFLNTDEHGAYDINGLRQEVGMRGIVVRLASLEDRARLTADAGEDAALRAYLARLAMQPAFGKSQEKGKDATIAASQVIELSVFDTGPGMALNWLKSKEGIQSYESMSLDKEVDAIGQCFEKHATTKVAEHSGMGLTMAVMAMRKLNAFMTLRTGRVSLYQDFASSRGTSFDPRARYPKARLGEVAGTAYTIWFKVR
jgi:hypothetical protein